MALDLRTARARNSLFWWLLFWLPLLKFWYHAQPEVSCYLRRPADFSAGKLRWTFPRAGGRFPHCAWRWPCEPAARPD